MSLLQPYGRVVSGGSSYFDWTLCSVRGTDSKASKLIQGNSTRITHILQDVKGRGLYPQCFKAVWADLPGISLYTGLTPLFDGSMHFIDYNHATVTEPLWQMSTYSPPGKTNRPTVPQFSVLVGGVPLSIDQGFGGPNNFSLSDNGLEGSLCVTTGSICLVYYYTQTEYSYWNKVWTPRPGCLDLATTYEYDHSNVDGGPNISDPNWAGSIVNLTQVL